MGWIECNLRGTLVFARAKADGTLDAGPDGRVDVKYKLDDAAKVYRAAAKNLENTSGEKPVQPAPPPGAAAERSPLKDTVIVYTDGACTGNPGPMGIGVVVLRGNDRKELSEFLGVGTNNIAELTAIDRALTILEPAERKAPVAIHTDSSYAIGVLSQNWKAKANQELIARIKDRLGAFPHARFVKVAGHAGVPENERCDELARQAISRRR
jgi:ribonuclease HI